MMDTLSIKKLEDFNKNITAPISAPVQATNEQQMKDQNYGKFNIENMIRQEFGLSPLPPNQPSDQLMEESKEPV